MVNVVGFVGESLLGTKMMMMGSSRFEVSMYINVYNVLRIVSSSLNVTTAGHSSPLSKTTRFYPRFPKPRNRTL